MDSQYDFIQTINTTQLIDEINTASLPTPDFINTDGTNVHIFFTSDLTSPQQSTLTTVVSNHIADPNYVPLATQAQIVTLLAYLNNSNTTTANTARSIIVQNIAPKLPFATLVIINGQIRAIVGS